MKLTEARDGDGKAVVHTPSGRRGKLTGFSGLVRVFVRYDDGVSDEYGTLPDELELLKVFDYATERDDHNVEVRFTDGSRYDIPTPEWRAIVDAAHAEVLVWTAIGDDD